MREFQANCFCDIITTQKCCKKCCGGCSPDGTAHLKDMDKYYSDLKNEIDAAIYTEIEPNPIATDPYDIESGKSTSTHFGSEKGNYEAYEQM